MQIKIKHVEQTWASNDGKKKIYTVQTEEGKTFKTFSDAIGTAAVGHQFDIEIYLRKNNRGQDEEFIKQVQRATPTPGQTYGGGGGQPSAPWTSREQGMRIGCAMNNAVLLACHGRIEIGSIDSTMEQLYHAMDALEKKINAPPKNTAPSLEDVKDALVKKGMYEKVREVGITKTDIVALIEKGITLDEIIADIAKAIELKKDDIPL